MKKTILALSFIATMGFADSTALAVFDKNHGEGPSLRLKLGPFEMRFAEKMSWTFRETTWNGAPLFVPSGFMQPVLNEAGAPKGKDMFLGTGHRGERVLSVDLEILEGGKTESVAVREGLSVSRGEAFTVVKKSRFESEWNGALYEHTSRVTVSAEGIREVYAFTALSASCSNVNYFYIFMHIFTNTTRAWAVGDDALSVFARGEFGDDGSFSLRKDIRYALVHDPSAELGMAIVYPETYAGRKGFWNSFWNRAYDNKLYLQIDPKRKPGESFVYECFTRPFKATAAEFESRGQEVVRGFVKHSLPRASAEKPNPSPVSAGNYIFPFDSNEGLRLAPGESIISPGWKGAACFELMGDGGFRYKKFPLTLAPAARYRITGAIKKSPGISTVATHSMVTVMNYTSGNVLETFGSFAKDIPGDGAWHAFSGEFTTSQNLTDRAGLVLYNAQCRVGVCFDEIAIERVP